MPVPAHSYDLDLFEYRFLLQYVLGAVADQDWTETQTALQTALDFCNDGFVASGRRADREGCTLLPNGSVRVPGDFAHWQERFQATFVNELSKGETAPGLHPSARYAMLELLMGANASFMTYFGFNGASVDLIERYGGFEAAEFVAERLRAMDWASCLCITEDAAGSDLTLITTRATADADGTYHVEGRKRLISAGMHDLAENIVYFVLARTSEGMGNAGLSCLAVPRYWREPDGITVDNHVRCVALPDKMGFRGCANATLEYGIAGPTRGYLMGAREGTGLLQLLTLMVQARVSTGIYALGAAANAYRTAVLYARERKQGRTFRQALNARAPLVPIAAHPDVARMLMSMKCDVEGGRALIGLLGTLQAEEVAAPGGANPLIAFLTPIIKAHLSDQAWKVCETAIQVLGGNGYLTDGGVEQAARDVKVLSIWEGTNYIQAQYLLRDVLGLGLRSTVRARFLDLLRETTEDEAIPCSLRGLRDDLHRRADAWGAGLDRIAQWARTGQLEEVPRVAARFLTLTSQLTMAWLLLRSAAVADAMLDGDDEQRAEFLRGKVAAARFYFREVLPGFDASAVVLVNWTPAEEEMDDEIFAF